MASTKAPPERHEAGRIVAFSDGVVAIAITLLILPLANIDLPTTPEAQQDPLGYVWQQNSGLITSFLITWIVIIIFWLVHHRVFGMMARVNDRIMLLNIIWLFAVVILPFPMNLLDQVSGHDVSASRQVTIFYLGTMFVISTSLSLISEELRSNPDLYTERARHEPRTARYITWSYSAYLGLLVVVAIFDPTLALWGLIGMSLIRPVIAGIESLPKPGPENG